MFLDNEYLGGTKTSLEKTQIETLPIDSIVTREGIPVKVVLRGHGQLKEGCSGCPIVSGKSNYLIGCFTALHQRRYKLETINLPNENYDELYDPRTASGPAAGLIGKLIMAAGKEIALQEDELGTPFATVDRTNWIDATLGRYHSQRISLPRDTSREYKEHLKNLVRTYVKDDTGNPVAKYIETGPDHFAHAQTYAEIALPLAASHNQNRPIEAFL